MVIEVTVTLRIYTLKTTLNPPGTTLNLTEKQKGGGGGGGSANAGACRGGI